MHTPRELNKEVLFHLNVTRLSVLLVSDRQDWFEKIRPVITNSENTKINIVATHINATEKKTLDTHSNCLYQHRHFTESDLRGIDFLILDIQNPATYQVIEQLARERKILTGDIAAGKHPLIVNQNGVNGHSRNAVLIANEKNNTSTIPINNIAAEGTEKGKRWRKIATWSLLVFAIMLIGHFILSYVPFKEIAGSTYKWYQALDKGFPIMLLAGFLAQLVDGALGMGYGVTSATILLSAGVSPAAMSGSIHTAEMFASGASGYSHYKFGNVNRKLFKALLVPGVLGAIGGAVLLVLMGDKYSSYIKPVIAVYTLVLGIKFVINAFRGIKPQKKFRRYRLLAAVGGFFDSFGGGGWGPIVTSTLINNGRSHKYVVGSVSLTEFFVTLASAFTFFTMIGVSHWQTILALIIGGLIAAPIAAKLAGKLPRRTSFMLLGALVIFWSIRILIKIF